MAGPAVLGRDHAAAARRRLARPRAVDRVGDGRAVGRLGAVPVGDGLVEFRVWAPNATRVDDRGRRARAARAAASSRRGCPAQPRRRLRLLARRRQAARRPVLALAARAACAGPRAVLDTRRVRVDRRAGRRCRSSELVIYELHVGTFTPEGTFDAAAARLPELAELGVTAVELMPVATFPGERGWGYDGVLTFAPHRAYGGPAGARALRRRGARGRARRDPRRRLQPRRAGLGAARAPSGPYFTDAPRHVLGRRDRLRAAGGARVGDPERRAVGARLPHRRPAARRGARDLRRERAARLAELAERVRAAHPRRARDLRDGGRRPDGRSSEWGHDAQWADELPPRAARPAHRRARRLLRALRQGRRPCARPTRTGRRSGS